MKNRDGIKPILLSEYQAPNYWARKVKLTVELDPIATRITSAVSYEHNQGREQVLQLNGKDLTLKEVKIDGRGLDIHKVQHSSEHLVLDQDHGLKDRFTLEITTEICPKNNTALEGLYLSHGAFFSQCEPHGFRRFTYFLDRPDVMAEYETTIVGDKALYPILLSNGNLVEHKDLGQGKHLARWHDPFPKPCYLFALVAGDLGHLEDTYTTRSGRKVDLHIYVDKENIGKCAFAFSAIKKAMAWDEEVYGLEYDLDRFMVVAVNDFNMGAMENKGLNIFNAKYVLASPETATDTDFDNILGIVGHEYFHNWSGNRVTLRDWFQLSLKEGLTVFRDQEFSAYHASAAVKRIHDVRRLREQQFPEDAGPMAHPVRPESYIEINNFYTATVYEKGAEVVRMLYSLLGHDMYFKVMTDYFKKFDGKAITVEDLLKLIEDKSGRKLDQFKLWYQQSGTPLLHVERVKAAGGVTLKIKQEHPETPGQKSKKPLLIPFRVAFIGIDKKPLDSTFGGRTAHEHLIEITAAEQSFTFTGIPENAIPSLLRGFTAPVRVKASTSEAERLILLAAETDPFNRYEATQQLAEQFIAAETLPKDYSEAIKNLLNTADADPRLASLLLQVPTVEYLVQQNAHADVGELSRKHDDFLKKLSLGTKTELLAAYNRLRNSDPAAMDKPATARRELRNTCLALLCSSHEPEAYALAKTHYREAKTMTDQVAALSILCSSNDPEREAILMDFYRQWEGDPLVIDKWFAAQASSNHTQVLQHVRGLLKHPAFDLYNPNRVYSVFRQFARCNPLGFHNISGEGYALVADYVIKLDRTNPQMASKIAALLSRYQIFDKKRQALMRDQLQRIEGHGPLSSDVYEVVSKSLAADVG